MAETYTISREGDGGISVERREVKLKLENTSVLY